mmetsp:Transcript_11046/g.31463  ORF Transcript_11046/g.31463 Transcript_11046/m.31463 type:complete len:466 (-) Transcript_11046:365-1762(-)
MVASSCFHSYLMSYHFSHASFLAAACHAFTRALNASKSSGESNASRSSAAGPGNPMERSQRSRRAWLSAVLPSRFSRKVRMAARKSSSLRLAQSHAIRSRPEALAGGGDKADDAGTAGFAVAGQVMPQCRRKSSHEILRASAFCGNAAPSALPQTSPRRLGNGGGTAWKVVSHGSLGFGLWFCMLASRADPCRDKMPPLPRGGDRPSPEPPVQPPRPTEQPARPELGDEADFPPIAAPAPVPAPAPTPPLQLGAASCTGRREAKDFRPSATRESMPPAKLFSGVSQWTALCRCVAPQIPAMSTVESCSTGRPAPVPKPRKTPWAPSASESSSSHSPPTEDSDRPPFGPATACCGCGVPARAEARIAEMSAASLALGKRLQPAAPAAPHASPAAPAAPPPRWRWSLTGLPAAASAASAVSTAIGAVPTAVCGCGDAEWLPKPFCALYASYMSHCFHSDKSTSDRSE